MIDKTLLRDILSAEGKLTAILLQTQQNSGPVSLVDSCLFVTFGQLEP